MTQALQSFWWFIFFNFLFLGYKTELNGGINVLEKKLSGFILKIWLQYIAHFFIIALQFFLDFASL